MDIPKIFENRNCMINFFSKKIENPKILEIGVFKGDFLDYIVENCNGEIDAVDIFEGETVSGDCDGNNVISYNIGNSYYELLEKYKNNSKVKLHKSYSTQFFENTENNKYDIIYIDGDHSYNGVKNDLKNAFEKIKHNGYIMGHNYEMNMIKAKTSYNFGVKDAVDEFCLSHNQTILSKAMDGCVSFCIKVNKEPTISKKNLVYTTIGYYFQLKNTQL